MTVTIVDVEAREVDEKLLTIRAIFGETVVRSTLPLGELETVTDVAEWLLSQKSFENKTSDVLQRRLDINHHTEEVIDPDTGREITIVVIDAVSSAPLPADEGEEAFKQMPLWSTWSADEAGAWIEENVVDLNSVKEALASMVRTIVHLRNITIG